MWLELDWINISFASHDMNNNAYGFLYQVGVKIKKEEKNTPKHRRCSVWRYMYKNENHITNVYKKNMPLIDNRCMHAYFERKRSRSVYLYTALDFTTV